MRKAAFVEFQGILRDLLHSADWHVACCYFTRLQRVASVMGDAREACAGQSFPLTISLVMGDTKGVEGGIFSIPSVPSVTDLPVLAILRIVIPIPKPKESASG